MITSLIVLACLVTDGESAREAYLMARSQAGRDADSQVRLALWCEAHGMATERIEHLARAIVADPSHATARGLLGMVASDGRWQKPDTLSRQINEDPTRSVMLADYATRRNDAPQTAEGQWRLAIWCEENGLKDEARAHLYSVVQLDPSRDAAWKRLGCKKVDGRWMSDDQVAARKADRDAQEKADRRWKPIMEKLRADLKHPSRADRARGDLAAITDPRALPMALRVFGKDDDAAPLVQLLGQIDSPGASRALATLAVFGASDGTRRNAVETLRRRDPREYADVLIALLRDPIVYHTKNVQGPGSVGELVIEGKEQDVRRLYQPPAAPGVMPGDRFAGYDEFGLPVVQRGFGPTWQTRFMDIDEILPGNRGTQAQPDSPERRQGLERFNQTVAQSQLSAQGQAQARALGELVANSSPTYDLHSQAKYGTPMQRVAAAAVQAYPTFSPAFSFKIQESARIPIGRMEFEAQRAAMSAQQQLDADVAMIESYNAPIRDLNDRASTVLEAATGRNFGEDRDNWHSWWVDQLGYRDNAEADANTRTRPTVVQNVPLDFAAPPLPIDVGMDIVDYERISCFGAGTPVLTITGPRPIESLQVGDRVLAQDEETGSLTYQPILVVHHNPPSPTLEVKLGGDTVVASDFHRFWVAGRGWTMARDLKPGDPVRTLEGTTPVEAISPGKSQPVFNLDVAQKQTFFAGTIAALVHDNAVPNFRATPFDSIPAIAASKP